MKKSFSFSTGHFWLLAGGVMLLSVLSALHSPPLAASFNVNNFSFTYELGYANRALMGSFFRLFYGEPGSTAHSEAVALWNRRAVVLSLLLLWGAMMLPIARMRESASTRLFLLAFASVWLVAPQWRHRMLYQDGLDAYVFLCAVLATLMLARGRPALTALFCIIGILVHSLMVYYCALMLCMIIFGLLHYPRYRSRMRAWLTAAIFPFIVAAILGALNNPENNVALLYKYVGDDVSLIHRKIHERPGFYEFKAILGHFQIFPGHYFIILAVYGAGLMIPCFLFAAVCARLRVFARASVGWYPGFLKKADVYLIFAAAIVGIWPTLILVSDASRMLFWSQGGIALTCVFLLWNKVCFPVQSAQGPVKTKSGKKKKNEGASRLAAAAAGFFCVLYYAFLGMPLVDFSRAEPVSIPCRTNCIPYVTDKNPLGKAFINAVYTVQKRSYFPIVADAEAMMNRQWPLMLDRKIRDGAIVIPAVAEDANSRDVDPRVANGMIYSVDGLLEKDETVRVRAIYDQISPPPPLRLVLFGQYPVAVASANDRETTWIVKTTADAHWVFEFYTDGGVEFGLRKIVIEKIQ